ncbi:hypothetical protein [Mesorhizobium sp. CAU 1732]|uniref:hypothetical protein n=1 Tax=Mesorhizobium sp. CAU 1732 TaxID=3140358 RepID=UPI00326135CD
MDKFSLCVPIAVLLAITGDQAEIERLGHKKIKVKSMAMVSTRECTHKHADPRTRWSVWLCRIVSLAGSLKRRRESVSRLPDYLKRDIGVFDTATIRRRR